MSETYPDDLLDQLVTVEPRPDWNDVLVRARRSRRRFGAAAVAVALFVLVPAAWAVGGAFYGSAPPPPIRSDAAASNRLIPESLAASAAAGFTPTDLVPIDLSKLHGLLQVQTPDGPLDVWGAPSTDGGHLCWLMALETDLAGGRNDSDGGCTQPGGLASNSGTIQTERPDVYLAYGYTDNGNAKSAQVTIKVGENVLSKTGPVVDGFYLVTFPRDPSATEAWDEANIGTEKVVTHDASGNEVETWQNPWQIPCPKPEGQGPCTPATP
jgi:hypothetical protein